MMTALFLEVFLPSYLMSINKKYYLQFSSFYPLNHIRQIQQVKSFLLGHLWRLIKHMLRYKVSERLNIFHKFQIYFQIYLHRNLKFLMNLVLKLFF